MDQCELQFLCNVFSYLNRYFIPITHCDDFSSQYLKNLETIKFLTRSKLTKYLFIFTSFLPESQTVLPNAGRYFQVNTLAGKLLTPHSLPLALQTKAVTPQSPMNANSNPLLGMLCFWICLRIFGVFFRITLCKAALQAQQQALQYSVEYRYFTNPTQLTKRDIELNDNSIWQMQSMIRKAQQDFFFDHLIRKNSCRFIRDTWLKWLAKCMHANKVSGILKWVCDDLSSYFESFIFVFQLNPLLHAHWNNRALWIKDISNSI